MDELDAALTGYLQADARLTNRELAERVGVAPSPHAREGIEAFRDFASRLPETAAVFVVSGGEDFLIHVAVPDTDALYAFVIDRLTGRPEVADVRTSIVYEHVRRPVLEPLPVQPERRKTRTRASSQWFP